MSYFRTAILLAALTALFMGIGFLIGGQSGMIIALLIAGAMNLFTGKAYVYHGDGRADWTFAVELVEPAVRPTSPS